MDEHGKVCKLADMGIGRPMQTVTDYDSLSEAGSILSGYTEKRGTTSYMSPEAKAEGGHYGQPTDIYSLGCVLSMFESLVIQNRRVSVNLNELQISRRQQVKEFNFPEFQNSPRTCFTFNIQCNYTHHW